jgi:hypothetical protein
METELQDLRLAVYPRIKVLFQPTGRTNPTTVSSANAAIRAGFSSHTGVIAAGFLIQRNPAATVACCA